MKKKLNYYKVGALVLMLIEIGIAIFIDKDLVRYNLNAWRLYVAMLMCIPINVIFICSKRNGGRKNEQ